MLEAVSLEMAEERHEDKIDICPFDSVRHQEGVLTTCVSFFRYGFAVSCGSPPWRFQHHFSIVTERCFIEEVTPCNDHHVCLMLPDGSVDVGRWLRASACLISSTVVLKTYLNKIWTPIDY